LEAGNGRTAVEIAQNQMPSLIVSDVDLPGMDGIQELRSLRENPLTAHIPIILITGQAQAQEREGMELGADDFIIKPFPMAALLRSVEARLHEHRAVEKVAERKLTDLRRQIGAMLPREFNAPLSEILVYSDVLQTCTDDMSATEIRQMATSIDDRARHLERVIKSFLLFGQLESAVGDAGQTSRMRSKSVDDIQPIVSHAARTKAAALNRTADLRIQLQPCRAELAPDLLSALIEELTDNAFRYSTTGKLVKVSSNDLGNFVELLIEDQGGGMDVDPTVATDAYVQLNSEKDGLHGLGLGLTISKRIAEIHGGSMEIDSSEESGAKVRVRLPARLQAIREELVANEGFPAPGRASSAG